MYSESFFLTISFNWFAKVQRERGLGNVKAEICCLLCKSFESRILQNVSLSVLICAHRYKVFLRMLRVIASLFFWTSHRFLFFCEHSKTFTSNASAIPHFWRYWDEFSIIFDEKNHLVPAQMEFTPSLRVFFNPHQKYDHGPGCSLWSRRPTVTLHLASVRFNGFWFQCGPVVFCWSVVTESAITFLRLPCLP